MIEHDIILCIELRESQTATIPPRSSPPRCGSLTAGNGWPVNADWLLGHATQGVNADWQLRHVTQGVNADWLLCHVTQGLAVTLRHSGSER